MKILSFAILLSILLTGFATPARADYQDGQRVPEAVIAPLMSWVERHVGVRVPALPQVVASGRQLRAIVSRMGPVSGRARALYVGGVVLVDDRQFDAEDSTQVSILVHELVHYAQSFAPRSWACGREKEEQAYGLQNQWLMEQGHEPFVTASWIKRMSACPTVMAAAE